MRSARAKSVRIKSGDRAALRAPLFVSGRGTSQNIRPRLRRGSNKEQWRESQQERLPVPHHPKNQRRNGRSPAPCEAQEPTPQRSLNPKESRPRRLANPTPTGVPIFAHAAVCKSVARDLGGRSPSLLHIRRPIAFGWSPSLLHIRRLVPFASSFRAPRAPRGILPTYGGKEINPQRTRRNDRPRR
jgi:hypothetical protein